MGYWSYTHVSICLVIIDVMWPSCDQRPAESFHLAVTLLVVLGFCEKLEGKQSANSCKELWHKLQTVVGKYCFGDLKKDYSMVRPYCGHHLRCHSWHLDGSCHLSVSVAHHNHQQIFWLALVIGPRLPIATNSGGPLGGDTCIHLGCSEISRFSRQDWQTARYLKISMEICGQ